MLNPFLLASDERGDGAEAFGLAKLFSDPNLLGRLATNPRTQKHLSDPSFVKLLQTIQSNPKLAESSLGQDPRMIDVLGVLMGIDMQGFSREEGSDVLPPGVREAEAQAPQSTPPQPSTSASAPTPKPPTPPPAEEDVEMEDDDAQARKEAELEKQTGASAYKARDFPKAAEHFAKAWEVWPKDVTFLTNLGGESFVQPTLSLI